MKNILPEILLNKIRTFLNKEKPIRIYFEEGVVHIDSENKRIDGVVPLFYWDGKPNFGDVIGPFLLSKVTGKPVLNIYDNDYVGLMAVGSILQSIDREGMVVWGSGLIDTPSIEVQEKLKKYKPKILSVRGAETARCLREVGISVPDSSVFGDPALTMPLFYTPKESSFHKIGICPHFRHKPIFSTMSLKNEVKMIDVQENMQTVVDEISSSSVCISTSLHGLIIAQAYKVPWVWLEVIDNNLIGDDFKFKDFFSTINFEEVVHLKVRKQDVNGLNFGDIAKKATLPGKRYDERLILGALETYLG